MYIPSLLHIISGITILISLLGLALSLFIKRRELFSYLRQIPSSLVIISSSLFLWGAFAVPKTFSGRGELGVWLMSKANTFSWLELLTNTRTPVHLWRTRFFSKLFDGVSYDFIVILNFAGFIISGLLIYLIVKNLTENYLSGYAASIFYLFSPLIFIFSLTEDYALPGIFFMILSLFFISIWYKSNNNFYLFPALLSSLLTAGSRTEYIFFPYMLLIFYFMLAKNINWKTHLKHLLIFFFLLITRTIVSVGTYFVDAQSDYALHRETYEYQGNLWEYIIQVLTGTPRISLIPDNIISGFSAMTNLNDLTGIFLGLSIIALFSVLIFKKSKSKKTTLFLSLMFFFLFAYYNVLHPDGITTQRYLIVAVVPLTIIAGIAIGTIVKNKEFLLYLLIFPIIIFTITTVIIPISFHEYANSMVDRNLKFFVFSDADNVRKEHDKYKSLSYENRLSRILSKETNIEKGERTYFIINGERSFLHTMPINGTFVPIWEKDKLIEIEKKITKNDIVYATQSEMGFTSHLIDNYSPVDPALFEKTILEIFELEKIIISYYTEGHHAFLYKMKKR